MRTMALVAGLVMALGFTPAHAAEKDSSWLAYLFHLYVDAAYLHSGVPSAVQGVGAVETISGSGLLFSGAVILLESNRKPVKVASGIAVSLVGGSLSIGGVRSMSRGTQMLMKQRKLERDKTFLALAHTIGWGEARSVIISVVNEVSLEEIVKARVEHLDTRIQALTDVKNAKERASKLIEGSHFFRQLEYRDQQFVLNQIAANWLMLEYAQTEENRAKVEKLVLASEKKIRESFEEIDRELRKKEAEGLK